MYYMVLKIFLVDTNGWVNINWFKLILKPFVKPFEEDPVP